MSVLHLPRRVSSESEVSRVIMGYKAQIMDRMERGDVRIPGVSPLLPLIFQLRGMPYDLSWSHFMMDPMFRVFNSPRRMLWKCSRQVSKSTSQAAAQIIRARIQPNYNILTILPLFEQTRKFSQNYVRPFISTSPIKSVLLGELSADSVLQRAIGDNSNLFYSYCAGDPNRIRGIAADEIDADEVQDLDSEDLPVIEQCMSASRYKIVRYTGTPKTFDNTIHLLWEDSSQAFWAIPCVCGYTNRSMVDGDLLNMIGDLSHRNDGSVRTLICAKCGRDLNSRNGYWVHVFPERQLSFPGYHVPQPILPMHYESAPDWQIILETRRDKPTYIFYNECLGESYDLGAKVITAEQINNACVADPCEPHTMPVGRYVMQALGIDWGGRGKEKATDTDDFISNTAFALAGLNADGTVDIPYLHKIPYVVDQGHEGDMAVNVASQARCDYVALDYGGQGNVQEGIMHAKGWPDTRTIPFTYSVMAPTKPIVFYQPGSAGTRSSYTLDKPRSILLLCELIKRKIVRLPDLDKYKNDHLRDFLALIEESIDNPRGSPRRLIKRMVRRHDDVVHAINFAVMGLFHATQNWPKVTEAFICD